MFWFDKQNKNVDFCDIRKFETVLCDGRKFSVSPDIICDFTNLPFADETYYLAVFAPPHLINVGKNSWLAKKYGRLPQNWGEYIKQGFDECMRVLKNNGILIFKWNETDITVNQIIQAVGQTPLFGHRSGKLNKTHWLCFMKGVD